jgi:hypothetical protein
MCIPSKRIDGSIYHSCCEDPHARLVDRKSLSVGCKLGKAVPATSDFVMKLTSLTTVLIELSCRGGSEAHHADGSEMNMMRGYID